MADRNNNINSRIALSIEKLIQVQRILLWDVAKKYNLSPIQTQFIIYLKSRPPERRKVSVMADEFDLTKATVSDAIKSLHNKGLLKKCRSGTDNRAYLLELTGEGKKISKKIENWQAAIIKNIRDISDQHKESAYIFMTDLIKSLFDNGIISTARMCLTCDNILKGADGAPSTCNITGRTFFDNEVNINCDNYVLKSS